MKAKIGVRDHSSWIPSLPSSLRHEFAMHELEQMQLQFRDFDIDGDGTISPSELVTLMHSMGIPSTIVEVQALIDKVDDNHSGELDFPEFVRLMSNIRRGVGDKLSHFIQYSKLVLSLRKERESLELEPLELTRVKAMKENAWKWIVIIHGPSGTPYSGGIFEFHLEFGYEYPYESPKLSCLTKIYHPNFVPSLDGTMKLYGFMNRWKPDWTMRKLLLQLENLFYHPDDELILQFCNESNHLKNLSISTPTSYNMFQSNCPRTMTMSCIHLYQSNKDMYWKIATDITINYAVPL